jgi:hypothetical protein
MTTHESKPQSHEDNGAGLEVSLVRSVLGMSDLQDVAGDLVELGVDDVLDNPIVNEIPVVKALLGITRGVRGYHEAWLTRKLIGVL